MIHPLTYERHTRQIRGDKYTFPHSLHPQQSILFVMFIIVQNPNWCNIHHLLMYNQVFAIFEICSIKSAILRPFLTKFCGTNTSYPLAI